MYNHTIVGVKMKKNKIVIILLIIIFFVAVVLVFSINSKSSKKQLSKKKTVKVVEKKQQTLEDIRKKENIVFLGDSITEFYPIHDIYLDLPIVKSGVSGYKTTDILDKMDEMVYRYNPTKVFILIGTNDLNNDDPKEVEENIKKIVENIKNNRKMAKIYVESIYPVNKSVNENVVSNRNNGKIKEVNSNIEEYCKKNNITYIDVYSLLEDEDGNLDKKYTEDGLHENDLGYARISQVLIKYIYDIEV